MRFTCRDADSAAGFDRLVVQTVPAIRKHEPGTLRVFYELHRDRAAFDAYEDQPHTRAFLAERGQYLDLASVEVDFLVLQAGKGTDG